MPHAHLPTGSARLIVNSDGDGPWNMAVDEVLLEATGRGDCALRFYHWDRPTVSLGYFQQLEDRNRHAASRELDLVRRASGGGALVHDGAEFDVTYSVAVPGVSRRSTAQRSLYDVFHLALIDLLRSHGVSAESCGATKADQQTHPFLCFLRHTSGDVLIDNHKVLGSAQRRSQFGLLQHGTVLLKRTKHAPELPGVHDLVGGIWDAETFREQWLTHIAQRWPVSWTAAELSPLDQCRAEEIRTSKFAHPHWNGRR